MGDAPDAAVDDGAAVTLVRAGDPAGIDVLFTRYAQQVYGFCWRRKAWAAARDEAAEDAMSMVFLQAWASRERMVLVEASARPWLLGVAANVLANERRSQRRFSAALARYHQLAAADPQPDVAEEAAGRVDAAAAGARAIAALAQLSGRERVVADLCLVEGLSTAQAAHALGLPEGTVKSRLDRGRRHLRALLRTSDMSDLDASSGHQPGRRAQRAAVDGSTPA